MTKTLSLNDGGFLKYAKLEMVLDGLNAMYNFFEENEADPIICTLLQTLSYNLMEMIK